MSRPLSDGPLDLLAIAAHPDDAELTCGGTLARAADEGYRTGILDLTRGEMASRGTPEIRAEEAARAGAALGVAVRANAGLPDARLENSQEARRVVVEHLRRLAPGTVILPYPRGRHPDHRIASELARDACFLAGLRRYEGGPGRRPTKIVYAMAYREDAVKPTFVVPLTEEQFRRKIDAARCYASQFDGATAAGEIFPAGQPLVERIETASRHYGSLIRAPHGEPFLTDETMRVDDIMSVGVASM
ncbi:bacillithiol biosynthesis deacetylase BshB1 [Candidatus Palauibacter sp.]|uniref:bacillithiol biosynthesis deacetylase BshB1 n=1 Tax=Candidatus Palauibacter sp. TaxID=3101350 RepID=UPI003AF2C57B